MDWDDFDSVADYYRDVSEPLNRVDDPQTRYLACHYVHGARIQDDPG